MIKNKKIKLLFIFHDTNYLSGATHSLMDIIDGLLITNNYEVFAVIPKQTGSLIPELIKRNIEIFTSYYGGMVYSQTSGLLNQTLGLVKCFAKYIISRVSTRYVLKRKVENLKIDLIYTNTSTIYVGAWLSNSLNIKHFWHFREFGKEDQNSIRLFKDTYFGEFVEKDTDKVIAISKALKNKYSGIINPSKINIVYNDLSSKFVDYHKKGFNQELNILISGTLSEGKGQKQVIEAMKILKEKDIYVRLFIAGNSKDDYRIDLENTIQLYELQDCIEILGFVENMKELRSKMDIGIVASRSEAFGRVTIEGMLSGMVIIAANSGASPELIEDKKTGLLYEWGDVKDLTDKIAYLYFNRDDLNIIGKRGFESALKFTEGNASREIERLILEELV